MGRLNVLSLVEDVLKLRKPWIYRCNFSILVNQNIGWKRVHRIFSAGFVLKCPERYTVHQGAQRILLYGALPLFFVALNRNSKHFETIRIFVRGILIFFVDVAQSPAVLSGGKIVAGPEMQKK